MLSPRLTNCPECANIPSILKKIDCKLAELGNNLYNNISYMLNKPIPAGDILQLIAYRRILTYKYCNPDYVHEYSIAMIASRVIRLTLGCVSRCNTPEPCIEAPCDITIVLNPTTTNTSTLPPSTTTTTTSTSSTSTTTSTTTTIYNPCPNCTPQDVSIGSQVWSKCNLDVTTYRNGDAIPEVTDFTTWASLTTGAWCYYNNDPANGAIYGKLYNWYAVNDPRGLAPTGYHIPNDAEFLTLVSFAGGSSVAGGLLKETGLCHWTNPNTGANNSTGWTALPGGVLSILGGGFYTINEQGYYWSLTDTSLTNANFLSFSYFFTTVYLSDIVKTNGFSVRCIKD
jgi:uncharacterized protein (TIGR02145 family)